MRDDTTTAISKKLYLMVRDPTMIKGDIGLSRDAKRYLKEESDSFWAVCPYSRASLRLKKMGEYYYVVDDIWVSKEKNTLLEDIAIDIAEVCAKWGRIHIKKAEDVKGAVRVDIDFGVPNLLWALYPRGIWAILRAAWPLKALSFLSRPLFFLLTPLTRSWQKFVYKKVYNSTLSLYPMFQKEIMRGMQHPEMLIQ